MSFRLLLEPPAGQGRAGQVRFSSMHARGSGHQGARTRDLVRVCPLCGAQRSPACTRERAGNRQHTHTHTHNRSTRSRHKVVVPSETRHHGNSSTLKLKNLKAFFLWTPSGHRRVQPRQAHSVISCPGQSHVRVPAVLANASALVRVRLLCAGFSKMGLASVHGQSHVLRLTVRWPRTPVPSEIVAF